MQVQRQFHGVRRLVPQGPDVVLLRLHRVLLAVLLRDAQRAVQAQRVGAALAIPMRYPVDQEQQETLVPLGRPLPHALQPGRPPRQEDLRPLPQEEGRLAQGRKGGVVALQVHGLRPIGGVHLDPVQQVLEDGVLRPACRPIGGGLLLDFLEPAARCPRAPAQIEQDRAQKYDRLQAGIGDAQVYVVVDPVHGVEHRPDGNVVVVRHGEVGAVARRVLVRAVHEEGKLQQRAVVLRRPGRQQPIDADVLEHGVHLDEGLVDLQALQLLHLEWVGDGTIILLQVEPPHVRLRLSPPLSLLLLNNILSAWTQASLRLRARLGFVWGRLPAMWRVGGRGQKRTFPKGSVEVSRKGSVNLFRTTLWHPKNV